jgi:hypothetical protein
MQRFIRDICAVGLLVGSTATLAHAQKALTWDDVRTRF